MRCAGFNTGSDFHLLDHIAPLAHLMNMPLFIEEEKNFTLSSHYYPMVETIFSPDIEKNLKFFATHFDALFECKYWKSSLKKIFQDFYQKEMLLVYCSHGQSDKGFGLPLLEPYSTQDRVLIYGDLFSNMLLSLNIPHNPIFTGNYRLSFYHQHKSFFDALTEKEIFSKLPNQNKTVLYAPTWNDADGATSFFKQAPALFSSFPSNWNLIVKVHPLLEQRDPTQYYRIAALLENKPNQLLVSEFPLIYPLLSKIDAYLGDYSSVGYDFLFFEKPMFFLLSENLPVGRLHSCGTILNSPEDLLPELQKNPDFRETQRNLYEYTFYSRLNFV